MQQINLDGNACSSERPVIQLLHSGRDWYLWFGEAGEVGEPWAILDGSAKLRQLMALLGGAVGDQGDDVGWRRTKANIAKACEDWERTAEAIGTERETEALRDWAGDHGAMLVSAASLLSALIPSAD